MSEGGCHRAAQGRLRAVVGALAFGAVAGATAHPCPAQVLGGYLEINGGLTESSATVVDARPSGSTSRLLGQRYDLHYIGRITPTFRLFAGGLFERDDVRIESEGVELRPTQTRWRPRLQLDLNTPVYVLQTAYERLDERIHLPDRPDQSDIRELISASIGWRPRELPEVALRFLRTNSFDGDRLSRDTTSDNYQLAASYNPVRPLRLYFRGTQNELVDRIGDSESWSRTESARVNFADNLLNGRVTVSSDYYYAHQETRAGELPQLALVGLAALDDTPAEGALNGNPALNDGNLTVSANVNLGLVPPGGNDRPRNIGLDFGVTSLATTAYVWIDGEIPPEIAATFAWQVWSSEDNRFWTREDGAFAASYDRTRPRFEIRFRAFRARYLKVVTRPLAPGVPGSEDYPTIAVTELEAVIQAPEEGVPTLVRDAQVYTASLATLITRRPMLRQESSYQYRNSTERDPVHRMSNGLSAMQSLGERYSFTARVARDDEWGEVEARVAHTYSLAASASPLAALRGDLVLSAVDEERGDRTRNDWSALLNSVASLYRGVDLVLSLSRGRSDSSQSGVYDSRSWNASIVLTPNDIFSLSASYMDTENSYEERPELDSSTRDGGASLSLRPFRSLYLDGGIRVQERTGSRRREFASFGVSWLPFAEGTLHFNLRLDESYQADIDDLERSLSTSLRWDVSPRSWLDFTYHRRRTEGSGGRISDDILRAGLRYGL